MKKTTKKKPIPTPAEGRRLRTEIEKLTGRLPKSWNPRTLRRALANIEAKIAAGSSVIKREPDATTFGVSMPQAARDAVVRMIEGSGLKASKWTRDALAYYADKTGHPKEAAIIRGDA